MKGKDSEDETKTEMMEGGRKRKAGIQHFDLDFQMTFQVSTKELWFDFIRNGQQGKRHKDTKGCRPYHGHSKILASPKFSASGVY